MSQALLPKKLQQLIIQLQQLRIAAPTAAAASLALARPLLQQLVQQPDWLPAWVYDQTKLQQGEAAYVLNHPQDDGFMLLLIAWQASINSCIHDHSTWSIVGLIEGRKLLTATL